MPAVDLQSFLASNAVVCSAHGSLPEVLPSAQSSGTSDASLESSDTQPFQCFLEQAKPSVSRRQQAAARKQIDSLMASPDDVEESLEFSQALSGLETDSTTARSEPSSSSGGVDQQALLEIVKQQDQTIQKLRKDKRLLLQSLRRKQSSQAKVRKKLESKIEELQRKRDFDAHRVSKNWEGQKKWSWLTPHGQANIAVPCLNGGTLLKGYIKLMCVFLMMGQGSGRRNVLALLDSLTVSARIQRCFRRF